MMDKIFNPESIAIWGLSSKENNIPRLIVENLIRWGFKGRLFGIHPKQYDAHVNGIHIYSKVSDLPVVPDLAVFLLPAKFIPAAVAEAGEFGIRRAAILSGGFNEAGEEGEKQAEILMANIKKYNMRFMGPNGLTAANTTNGLCLPFLPLFSPPQGGISIITQSGGVGLFLWNLFTDHKVGMAKFASIGNKLDITEIDCIKYLGNDPDTEVICVYLESITNGREFIDAAMIIDKPVIVFKSNTTDAGNKAAMSHTAAISNNEDIIDSAFERAGIIRIDNFSDFISVAKVFQLPKLKGDRLMLMSPAGGFTVMLADLCEKSGFKFAEPGKEFYETLSEFTNSGVISLSNPLDLGDIYNPTAVANVINSALHNENVDGVVFVTQNPQMPKSDDAFFRMFKTDISKEVTGSVLSSNKPFAACLYGPMSTLSKTKRNLSLPVFDSPETVIRVLKHQRLFYAKKKQGAFTVDQPSGIDMEKSKKWLSENTGTVGEDSLDLLTSFGINTAKSIVVKDKDKAVKAAEEIGFPVVMKIVSPDAIHKSEAGGVLVNIQTKDEVLKAFERIKINLFNYKKEARFDGIRIMEMVKDGYDMFIGGNVDDSFGPGVFFGFGGIYIEVFTDVQNVLAPSNKNEIEEKLKRLKSFKILEGTRGHGRGDINGYIDMVERVSHLLAAFPEIKELDLNPVRLLSDGSGVVALDARIRTE
jgi:acetyltransferase